MNSGQAFLHLRADLREPLLHSEAALHQRTGQAFHDREQHHKGRQGGERETGVHREHEGQCVNVIKRRVHDGQDAHPDHHADAGQVIDHARHQVAGAQPFVKVAAEPHQPLEQVFADLELDVAADVEDGEAGAPARGAHQQRGAPDEGGNSRQPLEVALLDRVDPGLEQIGNHHRQRGGGKRANNPEHVAPRKAAHVAQQTLYFVRLSYQVWPLREAHRAARRAFIPHLAKLP